MEDQELNEPLPFTDLIKLTVSLNINAFFDVQKNKNENKAHVAIFIPEIF
jgi:hypothetical protein